MEPNVAVNFIGSPDRARERAQAALEMVGFVDRAGAVPTGLTTLELRLMELARCRARAAGATLAIIEHIIQALVKLADRLVVLDHGRRLAEGRPEDVTKNPAGIEAYLGKRWLARHGVTHAEDLRS